MDKKLANNVVLGVFVLIGFVAFLFLIFNLGGGSGLFHSQYYLYGRFSQVKGLHYGSEVSLAGLRIGTVKDIRVAPDESKELIVQMAVTSKSRDQIRGDSVARINTQGMLGDKYIEISIGSGDSPVVKPDSFLPTVEVEDFFTKGGGLVEDIDQHFEKGGNIDKLLQNMNKIAANLAVLTRDTQGAGAKVAKASSHLESILKKVDKAEGTIGLLVNDPTVFEDLKTILGGAKRSTVLKFFMRQFMDDGTKAKQEIKKE